MGKLFIFFSVTFWKLATVSYLCVLALILFELKWFRDRNNSFWGFWSVDCWIFSVFVKKKTLNTLFLVVKLFELSNRFRWIISISNAKLKMWNAFILQRYLWKSQTAPNINWCIQTINYALFFSYRMENWNLRVNTSIQRLWLWLKP